MSARHGPRIRQSAHARAADTRGRPAGRWRFPVVNAILRFCLPENCTTNFGKQWNAFEKTQIDGEGFPAEIRSKRLIAETSWPPESLAGAIVLEVGSGAGRFCCAWLDRTQAVLHSIDYSSAIEANWPNNAALGQRRPHVCLATSTPCPMPPAAST